MDREQKAIDDTWWREKKEAHEQGVDKTLDGEQPHTAEHCPFCNKHERVDEESTD